ncbi:E3 ubiquitin-protein ligase MYLIP-like [Montipora capricornis]|uniref:E3 ubiquitin-protein ligase MYLIP-like n=1 Tax=Montipora foliosa TaxID=591990 RepID=UPI0035F1E9A3
MWCFISEPNGIIHEIFLPKNAVGQECLDKVCEKLKLVERDYFGLKFGGAKGAQFWLNLRNSLSSQLSGKPPYRLYFLVKFFVKPQELQQEITRHQYYLTLKNFVSEEKLDLSSLQMKTIARLCALISQIENGDYSQERVPEYFSYIPMSVCNEYAKTSDLQKDAAIEHAKLVNSSASESKIEFLHVTCGIQGYGIEVFHGRLNDDKTLKKVDIYVGSDGIRVFSINREYDIKQGKDVARRTLEKRVAFEDVSTVSYNNRSFTVVHGGTGPQAQRDTYKMKSESDAVALFRTFTEYHTFYQCNTVKRSVIDQCTRTFAGRLLSVFMPRNDFGRIFLFDVQRTRRQAYSHAWGELNSCRVIDVVSSTSDTFRTVGASTEYRPVQSPLSLRKCFFPKRGEGSRAFAERESMENMSPEKLKLMVRHLQDARVCQICMDNEVATAFCPCGHVVCCADCSTMCKECPLCRSQITYAQRVFFPCE